MKIISFLVYKRFFFLGENNKNKAEKRKRHTGCFRTKKKRKTQRVVLAENHNVHIQPFVIKYSNGLD
jgi:hypothetical protein